MMYGIPSYLSITVVVTFPMVEEPDVSLVAWTTTPWTLVSNLTLCVHPDMTYVRVKGKVSWERGCEVLYTIVG